MAGSFDGGAHGARRRGGPAGRALRRCGGAAVRRRGEGAAWEGGGGRRAAVSSSSAAPPPGRDGRSGVKKALAAAFAQRLEGHPGQRPGVARRAVEAALIAVGRREAVTDAWEKRFGGEPRPFFKHFRALAHGDVEAAVDGMLSDTLDAAEACGRLPDVCTVAVDYHKDRDFSAKHVGCVGTNGLKGTRHAMCYLSAESVTPDARYTFGVRPSRQAANRAHALGAVLDAARARVEVDLALMDKEFDVADAYNACNARGLAFVVPVKRTRRVNALLDAAYAGRRRVPDTLFSVNTVPRHLVNAGKANEAAVRLVFVWGPDPKDPSKDRAFAFAVEAGTALADRDLVKRAERYRERWGIETGYAVKDPFRPRTTSDHYPTRLFLQLWSLVAHNLWTLVRALCAAAPAPWMNDLPASRRGRYLRRDFRDDLLAAFAVPADKGGGGCGCACHAR